MISQLGLLAIKSRIEKPLLWKGGSGALTQQEIVCDKKTEEPYREQSPEQSS